MRQNNFFLMLLKVFFFSSILVATSAVRAELKVVTTIKPLHSLIANVMDGVGDPALIIEGSTSPHSFTLKPSHAKLLEEADIIFWVGESIETFMERPLESIVKNAEVVEFMEVESINKLKFREESIFDDHEMTMTTMIIMMTTMIMTTMMIMMTTMIMTTMMITVDTITTVMHMVNSMLTFG